MISLLYGEDAVTAVPQFLYLNGNSDSFTRTIKYHIITYLKATYLSVIASPNTIMSFVVDYSGKKIVTRQN